VNRMATIGLDVLSKQNISPLKFNGLSTLGTRPASRASVTAFMMMAVDILSVFVALSWALALGLGRWLVPGETLGNRIVSQAPFPWQLGYLAWFILTLMMVTHHHGLYGPFHARSALNEQRRTVQSCLTAGLLLSGAMYMMHNVTISRAVVAYLVFFTTVFFCISRAGWRYFAYRRYERGLDSRNVIVVGVGSIALALCKQIERNHHLGRVFKGFVGVPGNGVSGQTTHDNVIGSIDELRYLARLHFIDEIIIAESCPAAVVLNLVDVARECGIEVLAIPGFYDGAMPEARIEYLGEFPVVSIHHRDERAIASLAKRATDVLLSSVAILFLVPVWLTIALLIKLDSSGPVLYVSERIGKKGRVFSCFKFRTMVVDAERLKDSLASQNERKGILFKMKNDPRITRAGSILRKYSLDELPQILNVLRGEMSLVGPRPPLASEVKQYELEHLRRLEVSPGLTGLWQVRARQDPSFERYVALDLAYVENWSLWLDMKILVRTAEVVVRGTGS
jgi:exopolysaccharide biosynthesis polyprenyl glycosylphosphotransferase